MRKIISQEEKDKKTRRNQLIIGIILIGIMMFGTIAYAFSGKEEENSEKIKYNGIEFIKNGNYWNFNLEGNEFITKYNPNEVENISFAGYLSLNTYTDKPLYVAGNFNEPSYEINRNLNRFVSRINPACLSEDCEGDYPVKNCSLDNVVILQELKTEDEKESIYLQDKCVFINSNIENQTRYVDAFLFKILGI